jgi:hypothetical protein
VVRKKKEKPQYFVVFLGWHQKMRLPEGSRG